MGFDVGGRMIGELRAVLVRVAVEACFPPPDSRKADDITIAALIHHIHHDNDTVGRACFVPAMESDELGPVIKMKEMQILTTKTPRHSQEIAA